MNTLVEAAVKTFLSKAKYTGKTIDRATMNELEEKLSVALPDWFTELFTNYPLAGMYIDYPFFKAGEGEEQYYHPAQIVKEKDIYFNTENGYPGMAIRALGYICLLCDATGSGDPCFIKVADGDNSPVFLVYHDVSDEGAIIEKEGMEKIAGSLVDFFEKARPGNYFNPYEEENEDE